MSPKEIVVGRPSYVPIGEEANERMVKILLAIDDSEFSEAAAQM